GRRWPDLGRHSAGFPATRIGRVRQPQCPAHRNRVRTRSALRTPDERYTGRWEILRQQWTDSGLEVEIRVMADKGPIDYSFVAFGNDDVQATTAQPGSEQPQFSGMPIQSGNQETGWLFFPLRRGAATII
ncbi:hypothetical protein, partial [Sedimentibacter sp. B4]|uniref:hypothetical protein n=1 Tax=Sedimentibacter sp. B4 TaxID=304766 RepID=UPI0018DD37AE